jgi:hypothetical protein
LLPNNVRRQISSGAKSLARVARIHHPPLAAATPPFDLHSGFAEIAAIRLSARA